MSAAKTWKQGRDDQSIDIVFIAEHLGVRHLIMQCSHLAFLCRYIRHTLIVGVGGHVRGGIPHGQYAHTHTAL